MKLKMGKNSLYAVLLRSAWWVSVLVAAGVALVSNAVLPPRYVAFGVIGGVPFLVIAAITGWRQFRLPSAAKMKAATQALADMPWHQFIEVMELGYRQRGYEVKRLQRAGADLEARKDGRITVVSCKRWKAARLGIEPLRELVAASFAQGGDETVLVTSGEVTDGARDLARQSDIRLMEGTELATFIAEPLARLGKEVKPPSNYQMKKMSPKPFATTGTGTNTGTHSSAGTGTPRAADATTSRKAARAGASGKGGVDART